MEAALSKAAPDCCFKHVSETSVVNCTQLRGITAKSLQHF